MNDIAKLPFVFDVSRTLKQLQQLDAQSWLAHYNTRDYEGNWNVLALRSGWGHPSNIYSVPLPAENYQDTPLLSLFPDVQRMLDELKCPKTSVRFMRLCAGAVIKEHTDDGLDATDAEARLHIPIQTHEQVEFYLNQQRVQMRQGECWYLNFGKPHRVSNPSPADRIHLVIDCINNTWLRDLIEHAGNHTNQDTLNRSYI